MARGHSQCSMSGLAHQKTIESVAAVTIVLAAARSVGGLCVLLPSWCRQSGQLAAPVTGEPHLRCVLAITIITPASRNEEC